MAAQACQTGRAVIGDRLDILIANAGNLESATIEETTVEDFRQAFRSQSPRAVLPHSSVVANLGSWRQRHPALVPGRPIPRSGRLSAYAAHQGRGSDTLVKHFAVAARGRAYIASGGTGRRRNRHV